LRTRISPVSSRSSATTAPASYPNHGPANPAARSIAPRVPLAWVANSGGGSGRLRAAALPFVGGSVESLVQGLWHEGAGGGPQPPAPRPLSARHMCCREHRARRLLSNLRRVLACCRLHPASGGCCPARGFTPSPRCMLTAGSGSCFVVSTRRPAVRPG
jgi:hypothetical protein